MEALGINLGYLIAQILGIVILLILMKHFAYKPILRMLDERQARIAKGLEDARQAAIARDNADAEAKKIMDQARAEAAQLRGDTTIQAEDTAKGIVANAEDERKSILAKAREEAEEERNRLLADLRGQVADISIAVARKLVGESLDEKKQRQIIDDFLSTPPAGVAELSGDKAVVTSALPLTDKEKERFARDIKAKEIEYRVDPSILGGLIVRVGDRVIDNSVASGMREISESMKK